METPLTADEIYVLAAADGARPDPLLTVSEWSDTYRTLSQRASAEPGAWRTDRAPYLREIMDCLSPSSPVETVVLMKGAQLGGPFGTGHVVANFVWVDHDGPRPRGRCAFR
jgi:phage terminase large subunit GpA-like protein